MPQKRKQPSSIPTHDSTWDDSALIASWDAALEEYKTYHSLAAQGVQLSSAELEELLEADAAAAAGDGEGVEVVEDEEEEEEEQAQGEGTEGVAPFPDMGVKDEGVKSLMMAWYWAGYYTGLHEGQKKVAGEGVAAEEDKTA